GPVAVVRHATPGGQGIIGMAERAAVYGGTVTAGPVDSGQGWRVHAVLPWDETADGTRTADLDARPDALRGDGAARRPGSLAAPGRPIAARPAAPPPAVPLTELSARRLGPVRRYFVRHPVAMDVLVMALFGLPLIISTLTSGPVGTPSTDPTTRLLVAGL